MRPSTRAFATLALYVAFVNASVVHGRDEPSSPASAVVLPRESTHTISDPVTSSFLSFSVDPAFWTEFFGNSTHPNTFTMKLLKLIEDRSGAPIIRPGGVTQDSSIFDPEGGPPERTLNEAGGIYRTTWGPDFYQTFKNFSPKTRFIAPLNFGNNTLDIALDQAIATAKYVDPKKLFAFELGNEAGNYKATQRNLTTWKTDFYVSQWLNWTTVIDEALPKKFKIPKAHWWVGSDGITEDEYNTVAFQTTRLVEAGVNNGSLINEFSQHMYQYSSCRPASNARAIASNLFNHTNITSFVDIMANKVQAARTVRSQFVVGEYNSVSCSGKVNLTDTFGQNLWVLDTSLASATVNVTRMHLHMGATLVFQSPDQENIPGINGTPGFSSYSLWYPRDSPLRGRQRANPSYTSHLFLAELIGKHSRSRIQRLAVPTTLEDHYWGGYAVYENDLRQPKKLALINWAPYNTTVPNDTKKSVTLDIRHWIEKKGRGYKTVTAKRLTAPGIDTKDSDMVTWAGQAFTNGTAVGREKVQRIENGIVELRGSEALLVFL